LSCVCDILAIFIAELREVARIVDCIADLVYHCVSGCMTAQVAHEMNYQVAKGPESQSMNHHANPAKATPM
jgi:hypothetical protein